MFTVLSNSRTSNLNIALAIALTMIVVLTFVVDPTMVALKPPSIPVTGNQDAYFAHILSEKVSYTNPIELSNALTEYHLGEKVIVGNVLEAAMLNYYHGEKAIYQTPPDLNAALIAYHLGEKEIVDTVGSELIIHHLGEKDIK